MDFGPLKGHIFFVQSIAAHQNLEHALFSPDNLARKSSPSADQYASSIELCSDLLHGYITGRISTLDYCHHLARDRKSVV